MSDSRAIAVFVWLALVACAAGCDGRVLIGSECHPGAESCAPGTPLTLGTGELQSPPGECLQVVTEPYRVPADAHAEFCLLATLKTRTGPGSTVYFSRKESNLPQQHRVFVLRRPVGRLPEMPDGEVDCGLAMTAGFQPLFGSSDVFEFDEGAAVEVSHGDQLLFINHYQNMLDVPQDVPVRMNLICSADEPSVFVHQFAFTGPTGFEVPAGASVSKRGECPFSKALSVLMVYRQPNHRMERFAVEPLSGGGPIWETRDVDEWQSQLVRPMWMGSGDGFTWECEYFNPDDAPVNVADSADSGCSLFGFYQLRDGGRDRDPEACVSGQ